MSASTQSSSPRALHRASNAEAFALWSRTYDDEVNPLLTLEKRFLECLLPSMHGRNVLDVGCGTGRWLQRLAERKPARLVGVDSSPAMLSRAVSSCGGACTLLLGEATALPVSTTEFDLVLASFVLSYVEDLRSFVSEIARVTHAGSRVFISDIHPSTATTFHWKRAFHSGDKSVNLATNAWRLAQILPVFEEYGFQAIAQVEPSFGNPERVLLEQAGKGHVYIETESHPAIYVLEFLKQVSGRSSTLATKPSVAMTGARVSFGAEESAVADVCIEGGKIFSIGSCDFNSKEATHSLNLSGYLLLPGLVNGHDHLDFGLFPRLGYGPYTSFLEWANDIHDRDRAVIARLKQVPKDVSVWWGAIHNLLCGVTTVCHHDPISPEMYRQDFPVRILSRFGWAHSISMEHDLSSKFGCTPADVPFILHLGEGVSEASAREIFQLDCVHALDERTILVHGLALGEDEMGLVNRRKAAIVWCPTSNYFLFGRTHTKSSVALAERIVLGSDSPLTSAGDLLDEIRFACSEVGVTSRETYQQVTTRAAEVFRLTNGQGTLIPGSVADVVAVRQPRNHAPADVLCQLTYEDVELVMLGGRVQLASEELICRLPAELACGLQRIEVENTIRWIRAPLQPLFEGAERILGPDLVLGGRRVRYLGTECS